MRLGTVEDMTAHGAAKVGDKFDAESWLGVPVFAGDRVFGVMSIDRMAKHAFTEADERLLATIASNMGVALENARLFDETKRLLTETEQRNAELAVINEISEALAKQLDFQRIVDAVGDRVRAIFGVQTAAISLYDPVTRLISSPYTVDLGVRIEVPVMELNAFTERMIRDGLAVRTGTSKESRDLGAEVFGTDIAQSFLGVPITAGDRILGLISIERVPAKAFDQTDERLLSTIASNMGVALENARLFDETKHLLAETDARAGELAIINEIGGALAEQLDFQAIIDLVGERVGSILDNPDVGIALYDPVTNIVSVPYSAEDGKREYSIDSFELGVGLTSRIIQTRRPLRVRDMEEAATLGARLVGDPNSPAKQSFIGVPIPAGDRVLGVLSAVAEPRDYFTDSHERLLSTLAASMGVALENARLFDETKRLLTETEQRNAELAVINEIGEALAKQLDFQRIIDAVGDRIRTIFRTPSAVIALYDAETKIVHSPYFIDQGQRLDAPPRQLGGLVGEVITSRRPLRMSTREETQKHSPYVLGTDDSESWLGVPILAGERVLGMIALERLPRNAFSESDERLLATIASNLGVALENARLFDETRRLLTETEQRASELSIINEIGSALAEKLDFDAIVDLVGDRLSAMFKSHDFYIALYDRATNLIRFPYEIDDGRRVHGEPIELGKGVTSLVLNERRPFRFGTYEEQTESGGFLGTYIDIEGKATATESWLGVPILAGREAIGVVVLGDRRTNAFSEADERLVGTIASSTGVALENARLFDETKRLLQETDERAAELAIINSVQQGLAEKLEMQAMYDLVGDKIQEIFDAQVVDIGMINVEEHTVQFLYSIESGERDLNTEPIPFGGFTEQLVATRRPVVINDVEAWQRDTGKRPAIPSGQPSKAVVFMPMLVGDELRGHDVASEHR